VKALSPDVLSGARLYGDDFAPAEIGAWFEAEQQGYHGLVGERPEARPYEYAALNDFHAFDFLRRQRFDTCVALGCAWGDDVAPLAPVVQRFVAIEPAREWWRDEIAGRPARYVAPAPSGAVDIPSHSADLAVSLGVLHHIPNVSAVVTEMARVLKSGGLFVLREPVNSMGDWRQPRTGLTAHERGIPRRWLRGTLEAAGFSVERDRPCMFGPLPRVWPMPYASKAGVLADAVLSTATQWNTHYWQDRIWKKLAPSSVFMVARRR
jgi:SAM-dependent methyltransferase